MAPPSPHPLPRRGEGEVRGRIGDMGKGITASYEHWELIGDLSFEAWIPS